MTDVVNTDRTSVFERRESAVRSYSRVLPGLFDTASGSILRDVSGREYIDFLAGAGSLNYGHNNPDMRAALVAHLSRDGITSSLDLYTEAKRRFLEAFEQHVLAPRDLDYQRAVHRPDRRQRRRGGAEARPQGHRADERHRLHQRLPRRVAGGAGGHRQQPPPHGARASR